ncbi:hypothetical protein FOMPIDRAFT_1120913 [Fomitopsis schrenkii]|uniref:Zn(2)-C6 fungal-type domain-containing protein n=1 Tax=Fomitopsis schrenkii TaxID=2126942 RepID=S8FIQ9_FOMSC|nr:hypothetical protein FOMPIDRAFT_1120913 [Fomitopsis schrenkii]
MRACTSCRSFKIRCRWIESEGTCVKCKTAGIRCVMYCPQNGGTCPDYTQLLIRSEAQDAHIRSLLSQLDGRRQLAEIRHYVAAAHAESLSPSALIDCVWGCRSGKGQTLRSRPDCLYSFVGGIIITNRSSISVPSLLCDFANFKCPPVLLCGLFGPAEVTALFRLYFEHLYPSFPILDPALHTPEYLLPRSTMLFTAILYLASRLWTHRPKLHRLAQEHVVESIKEAMRDGPKTIEMCQAFAVLSVFPAPHDKYLDSRGSMFIELAVRIAQDLRLDEPPPADLSEREKLNRLRTWFEVLTVSSFDAIRAGRPAPCPRNNFTSRMSASWYRCSALNSPFDFYTSAYADLLLFVSSMWGPMGPTGIDSRDDDLPNTILSYHQCVCDRVEMWNKRREEQRIDPAGTTRTPSLCVRLGYALRLIVLGVGIQHSLKRNLTPGIELVNLSIEAANQVLKYGVERIYPTGFLRYVTEPQYLYVTYSAAFLINLLRQRLISLLGPSIRENILRGVHTLIEVLSSKEVALDRAHIAFVYAGFLEALVDKVSLVQDLVHNSESSYPLTPTQDLPSPIPAHRVALEGQVDLCNVDAAGILGGPGFAVSQFAAEVALHGSEAYPASQRASYHGFPMDVGTW